MKIVRGGLVVTMDLQNRVLRDGAVAIDGPTIVAVGPWTEIAERYPGADVRGRSDAVVLPGLVNAHNHLFQVLYRTLGADLGFRDWLREVVWPMSCLLGEEEAHAAALLAGLEMLKTGTTTVVDSHYINLAPGVVDAVAEAVERIGMRAVLGRASMDWSEWAPILPQFLETPDSAQRAAGDLISRWHGRAGGRIRIRPEPLSETSASPEMVRALHEVAIQHHTGMNMHAAEVHARVEFIQARFGTAGTIEYLDRLGILGPDLLLAHCVWLAPEEIALLRERGVAVVHNPVSNQFLGDGIAPLPDLLSAGIPVGLGTDGPCSNDSLDMFGVMKAGALIHKAARQDGTVTKAETILTMATRGGARAAGLDGVAGSIEVGKHADLVVVRLRRPEMVPLFDVMAGLVYSTTGAGVDLVLVDGQVVVEDGRLRTIDEDEIMRGAERLAWRLLRRAGGSALTGRAERLGWQSEGARG
jgi:5-methylthioadenosine/S-adenosylhomocysteine deaminase